MYIGWFLLKLFKRMVFIFLKHKSTKIHCKTALFYKLNGLKQDLLRLFIKSLCCRNKSLCRLYKYWTIFVSGSVCFVLCCKKPENPIEIKSIAIGYFVQIKIHYNNYHHKCLKRKLKSINLFNFVPMKNSIEELISSLEMERTQCFRLMDNLSTKNDKSQEFILVGKILAYNFCIEELLGLIKPDLKSAEHKT